jgi:predicted hotdog family 3-hydroxylacyl-ACP dehydratase
MNVMPSPATLLPHTGDAVLLDEIRNVSAHRLDASLRVRPGTAFSDAAGCLPGWVGPEIMAQAIAALSGHRSLAAHGRPAAIGLLLGVRSYETAVAEFRPGEALSIEVIESSADETGQAVFDCRIHRADEVLAVGTLTVFQPADNSFFEQECTARG